MNRYETISTVRNESKTRYYRTNIYPQIPLSENDLYVIATESDRYDLLAYTYYQDVTMWWVIPVANNLACDSLYPPPGLQLRIPVDLYEVVQNYILINSQ